eukprot:TRINITY_DN9883_c0_g1_i1.p1 TRINITY_DN9883_c0_g1~~TRINITY_DN9883_c0_g1_i1.p1  ORF type:complete len:349 (-),score=37.67 TRINITY_DN9883_c0_g1_i1:695-1675(-)
MRLNAALAIPGAVVLALGLLVISKVIPSSTGDGVTTAHVTAPAPVMDNLYQHWIIVPEIKLLFCFIEKVGCESFNDLFRSYRSRWDPRQAKGRKPWRHNNMKAHNMSEADVDRLVLDETWHKAVFFREPLERFLSAFRSKCEPGHDIDREHCTDTFGSEDPPFAVAVDRLRQAPPITDAHWRPQSDFCGGLPSKLSHFQTVEQLDPATSHEKVSALLHTLGVQPESIPAFHRHFPRPASSAADSSGTGGGGSLEVKQKAGAVPQTHLTHAADALRKYYLSPAMACAVVQYYIDDYLLFGIALPQWAREWGFHADHWASADCSELPS